MPETITDDAPRETFSKFAALLGEPFDLLAGEATERLTLIEATSSGAPYAEGAREPFSLLFRSEARTILPQGIRQLRHATLGEFDMFLVPIARDDAGTVYQAIFN